jgi:hypothetical protein
MSLNRSADFLLSLVNELRKLPKETLHKFCDSGLIV